MQDRFLHKDAARFDHWRYSWFFQLKLPALFLFISYQPLRLPFTLGSGMLFDVLPMDLNFAECVRGYPVQLRIRLHDSVHLSPITAVLNRSSSRKSCLFYPGSFQNDSVRKEILQSYMKWTCIFRRHIIFYLPVMAGILWQALTQYNIPILYSIFDRALEPGYHDQLYSW